MQRGDYVVTLSRPYPARQSREVEAVSGWRLGVATSLHLPPWAIQHLKGKTETGINASVIYPKPIIRSPYVAPLPPCPLAAPPRCLPCQHVNLSTGQLAALGHWPTGQLVNVSTDQGLTGCVHAISTSPPTGELCMGLVEVMRART